MSPRSSRTERLSTPGHGLLFANAGMGHNVAPFRHLYVRAHVTSDVGTSVRAGDVEPFYRDNSRLRTRSSRDGSPAAGSTIVISDADGVVRGVTLPRRKRFLTGNFDV